MIIIDKNAKREVQVKYPDRTRVLFPNLDDGYISSNDIVVPGINAPISDDGVAVASINDGAEGDAISKLVIGIDPVQDLHGQSNPYPPGGGKNLCPIATMDTTNGGYINSSTGVIGTVVAGTQYTFSLLNNTTSTANLTVRMRVDNEWVDLAQGNLVSKGTKSYTFTPENSGEVSLSAYLSADYSPALSNLQLEKGSTATEYAPYSNICPITGHTSAVVTRTGVNVWDEAWEIGDVDVATGQNKASTMRLRSSYISVKPNTAYYICIDITQTVSWFFIFFYDSNKNYLGNIAPNKNTVNSTPTNTAYIRFVIPDGWGGADYVGGISINYPSTDHDYHAYTGEVYEIDLDGTRYGGTLDVTTGVLTVDRAIKEFTSADASEIGVNHYSSIWRLDWKGASSEAKTPESTSVTNIMCNAFKAVGEADRGQAGTCFISSTSKWIQFDISDTNIDNATSAKNYFIGLSPVVLYKLATPTTVQLTPQEVTTLLGNNTIYADCGDVLELSYSANMNIRLQDLLNEKLDKPTTPGTLGQVLTSDGEGGQTWETPE